MEKNKKFSVIKSKLFLALFCFPYATWFVISILAVLDDEGETEKLAWGDMLLANLIILLGWFAVSFVISLIVSVLKKPKTEEIEKYDDKTTEKIDTKSNELLKDNNSTIIEKEKVTKDNNYMNVNDNKITIKEKNKSKNKSTDKDTLLHSCNIELTLEETQKFIQYVPAYYWFRVGFCGLLMLIFVLIIGRNSSVVGIIVEYIVLMIIVMIGYKLSLNRFVEMDFNKAMKKSTAEKDIEVQFYEDYLIRAGKNGSRKIPYNTIKKIIETDTNFYIKSESLFFYIQKNMCDLDTISFIRNINKNILDNRLGNSSKFKGAKKYHNPKVIKVFMIILFIITIASLWWAMGSIEIIDKINPQHGFNFTKNTWVLWCWLPIPILSIVLGYKYKRAGFKCTKNIVAGFIIGILLLLFGAFCLFPTYSEDYNEIYNYQDIIGLSLPSNGELEIIDWGTYFDDDKTEYSVINAYYDKEDVTLLVNSIKNNIYWMPSKEIKSELRVFVPSQLRADDDAYFSIYNKTTNQYSTLPETTGNYEIYAMKYDISEKHLEIHKFNYSYK